jgi:hypothetical protein
MLKNILSFAVFRQFFTQLSFQIKPIEEQRARVLQVSPISTLLIIALFQASISFSKLSEFESETQSTFFAQLTFGLTSFIPSCFPNAVLSWSYSLFTVLRPHFSPAAHSELCSASLSLRQYLLSRSPPSHLELFACLCPSPLRRCASRPITLRSRSSMCGCGRHSKEGGSLPSECEGEMQHVEASVAHSVVSQLPTVSLILAG